MLDRGKLPHLITVTLFVVFIVLGLACATTPSAQIVLSENYRGYLQQPAGNQRVIDSVGVGGSRSFVCRDTQHSITASQTLGATYQLGGEYALRGSTAAQSNVAPSERHRDEPVLDQLLNEAKSQYPTENVTIKNARTSRHIPTNARQEEYTEYARRSDGSSYPVTRTRLVWDCYLYYAANVITTEPMPQPVTHAENFTAPGATRADIYRRTINWIDDNTQSRRITVEAEDIDRGRIRGTITCAARADQTYIVISSFTIDVYDARVEIRFSDTAVRRTDPSLQSIGNPEPIFLQSIADAALVEIVDFSTTLRSSVLSRL
jgi:hypothetical protein